MGERQALHQTVLGKRDKHTQGTEPDRVPPQTPGRDEMGHGLKPKPEAITLPERNQGRDPDAAPSHTFWTRLLRWAKQEKRDDIELKSSCAAEETNETKSRPTERGRISARDASDKGPTPTVCEELYPRLGASLTVEPTVARRHCAGFPDETRQGHRQPPEPPNDSLTNSAFLMG